MLKIREPLVYPCRYKECSYENHELAKELFHTADLRTLHHQRISTLSSLNLSSSIRNGSNESSNPLNHLNMRLCVKAIAMRIMSLQKSFFMVLEPVRCLGRSIDLQAEPLMHSCNLLSPPLLAVELLAESMEQRVLRFLNQITHALKSTSKLFVFPSCFPFYTQMNSYSNTQMEVFLQ